jgi:tetratricopeptide (TPR) repeat protein
VAAELAQVAAEVGNFELADQWAQRILRCIKGIEDRYAAEKRALPDGLRSWRDRLSAIAWFVMGLNVAAHQRFDYAQTALSEATRFARSAGNGQLLSAVCLNRAYLAGKLGLEKDRSLLLIRAAETYACEANSVQKMAEAAHYEALTLAALSEYHASEEAVARGLRYAGLGVSARTKASLAVAEADLERRRGRPDEALKTFMGILKDTEENLVVAAQYRILMAECLAFAPETRPALIEALDWVLERIKAGSSCAA